MRKSSPVLSKRKTLTPVDIQAVLNGESWHVEIGDCVQVMKRMPPNCIDAIVCDPPYLLAFMGKTWDSVSQNKMQEWHEEWVREALRVLKPGGYLLAFGGTRTYHRLVCAVEDAGFEIRDTVSWLYGSGFPKGHDVSKAIDKLNGAKRKVAGKGTSGKTRKVLNAANYPESFGGAFDVQDDPVTEDAKKWNGWNTALKPAHEPIVVARKPLSEKTVAKNVLEHGTGAINIDGCRVGLEGVERHSTPAKSGLGKHGVYSPSTIDEVPTNKELPRYNLSGRWPANLVLDEEAAAILGETSRFFYVAKAGRKERNAGLEEMPLRRFAQSGGGQTDAAGDDERYADSIGLNRVKEVSNNHPTVKPINLMRWLVRLVTPPGGVVLDPFMGSGTTGIACVLEGFRCIGIEQDEDYAKIARTRICHWEEEGE